MARAKITSPDDAALADLCGILAEQAGELDLFSRWPAEQLRLCGEYGVFEWFIDPAWGGQGWSDEKTVRGYLALSAACLTTTFIITQRTGACRRIATSDNHELKQRLLPGLARGELMATVGISHLTTSRRHLGKAVLAAERVAGGFRLRGFSPWVTGGAAANVLVLGATVVEGGKPTARQILVAVPTDLPGLTVAEPHRLVGLSASSTGPIELDGVEVADDWLIAGPVEGVMTVGVGANTGGYETSTLAIGLAAAALDFLADEAARRPDLAPALSALRKEHAELQEELLSHARGKPLASRGLLRQRANSLALRSTQAVLSAAKGTGYVVGHPAGRWCREALFFLVWSCPPQVASANLCELAGISS